MEKIKVRRVGQIIWNINQTLTDAIEEKQLISLRSTKLSESSGGFYSPYSRDILRTRTPNNYDELKGKFSELEQEYIEAQATEDSEQEHKTHKNIPEFLPNTVFAITIRKNLAHKGFNVLADSEYKFELFSARLDRKFETKEDFQEALQIQENEMLNLAKQVDVESKHQLTTEVSTIRSTTSILVSQSEFYKYAQSLGHEFSRIRYRWQTGKQYRAKLQHSDGTSSESKWGVMILPHDSTLSSANIHFPLPRKPRKNTLEDPNKATKLTHIGSIRILTHTNAEIFLVKE